MNQAQLELSSTTCSTWKQFLPQSKSQALKCGITLMGVAVITLGILTLLAYTHHLNPPHQLAFLNSLGNLKEVGGGIFLGTGVLMAGVSSSLYVLKKKNRNTSEKQKLAEIDMDLQNQAIDLDTKWAAFKIENCKAITLQSEKVNYTSTDHYRLPKKVEMCSDYLQIEFGQFFKPSQLLISERLFGIGGMDEQEKFVIFYLELTEEMEKLKTNGEWEKLFFCSGSTPASNTKMGILFPEKTKS